ncbi:MAG: hypothetical protein L0271_26410 [Gemmatimonadetes bacterium]|nr:hypothetical protein [Gemmatimonadota bacterium]
MTATPARLAALATLRDVRAGILADRAVRRAADTLPRRDRSWTRELVFGTLRLRGRLDHALASVVHRPLESVDSEVLDVLRLGAYQLLEMRSVPVYAAVSQSVDLVKLTSRAAPGFVNAALNALARARDHVAYPAFTGDPVASLTTRGSHPEWIVRRWIDVFGAAATRLLVEANNARPGRYVRPIGRSVAEALSALQAAGIGAEDVTGAPDAIRVTGKGNPAAWLAATPAIVQDPAAGLVARYVAAPAGSLIVDLCAAPGGKAIALADATRNAYVVAADVSAGRVRRLRANLHRLESLPVCVVVADARRPPVRDATVVLLDAPCTGTGTFRRRPDARWRLRPADLRTLCLRQAELLDGAARIVRPGGLLVYATCSIEREENDDQVDAFLERNPEFASMPPDTRMTGLDQDGRLRLFPHVHGFDGAFAARLRRL